MITKTIIILANSFKHHERCIAGRELKTHDGGFFIGPWIRPVSGRGRGELDVLETAYPGGAQVAVWEIASVKLLQNRDEICQPENWLIAGRYAWDRPQIQFRAPPLAKLEEHPKDLWIVHGEKTDRIGHEDALNRSQAFSICVIRPEKLRLVCRTQQHAQTRREEHKMRVSFSYRGLEYDLSLTDPVATERYGNAAPRIGSPPKILPLRSESGPLVCVSLTPPFNGYHYKVVATILGMPANE